MYSIFYNILILLLLIINKINLTLTDDNNDVKFLIELKNKHVLIETHSKIQENLKLNKNFDLIVVMLVSDDECPNLSFDVYENNNKTLLISNVIMEYSKFANYGYYKEYILDNKNIQNTNPVMFYTDKVTNKCLFNNI